MPSESEQILVPNKYENIENMSKGCQWDANGMPTGCQWDDNGMTTRCQWDDNEMPTYDNGMATWPRDDHGMPK